MLHKGFSLLVALHASPLLSLAAAQGNKGNCSHPTAFFEQLVDHSTGSGETFAQQYQVIDDYFQPGGSIIFYQGAESKSIACLVSGP